MPRARKPTNVLALSGAFKHNPKRGEARKDEPKPTEGIGEPPEHLDQAAAECWREIVGLAHAGTLSSSDRLILEHGSNLLAQLRASNWLAHPTVLLRFEAFLTKLGLTPADRSRVSVKKPGSNADPLDEFLAAG